MDVNAKFYLVAIAYIMVKHNLSVEEAFQFVHTCRPSICPNDGFRQQLHTWGNLKAINKPVTEINNINDNSSNS